MGIPLVALQGRPVETPDIANAYARGVQVQGMLQDQQAQAQQMEAQRMQNEQMVRAQRDQEIATKAYSEAGGVIKNAIPLAAKYGATPQTINAMQKAAADQEKSNLDLLNAKGTRALQEADLMQGAHDAVDKASPEMRPAMYQQQLANLQSAGIDVSQMPQEYPGDQAFSLIGIGLKGHKQQLDEIAKAAELALTQAQTQKALAPEKVSVEEQQMKDWLAKNPGKGASDYKLWVMQHSPSAMTGNITLTPEAYQMAGQLYANTGQLPGGLSRSPQTTAKIINTAAAANPGGDIAANKIQYQTTAALNKDFFGGGKASQNIRSLNTAVGHLNQLYDAAEALKNNDIKVLNRIANAYKVQAGNSAPQVFDAIATAAAGELGSTFKGAAATDPEIAAVRATISKDLSGKVNQDVIRTDIHLLASRLYALEEQYRVNNGGKAAGPGRILYNGSKKVFDRMGVQPESNTDQPAQGGIAVGTVKTFPNGRKGVWDGRGWVAQ